MANRVANPDKVLPDFIKEGGSKISNVVYGDKGLGLAILSGDSVVVFEDQAIDKIILQPLQEQLDQQLVEFGIPGRNGNIIQATGANNKVYNWDGVIYSEDPFKTKEYFETLIRKNNPIPYRVFYMQKSIQVFVQSATFSVFDKCRIEYSMVCVEYTPPEIVSFDAEVWMNIVGDYNKVITDPNDVEGNPCLDVAKHTQSEDGEWIDLVPFREWLKNVFGVETSVDKKKLSVEEFGYGDIKSSQTFIDAMSCEWFSESTNAQKKLTQVFMYLAWFIQKTIREKYGEEYFTCVWNYVVDSEYKILLDLIDEIFLDGSVELGVVDSVSIPLYVNGSFSCDNLKNTISTWSVAPVSLKTKIDDIVFPNKCCGDYKPKEESAIDMLTPDPNKGPSRQSNCPDGNHFLVSQPVGAQQNEYTCWKKDGGTHGGLDTYEQIDCDSDDFKNNQDHPSYYKSYDNKMRTKMSESSPHVLETQNGVKFSIDKGSSIYAPFDGTVSHVPPYYNYIQINTTDEFGAEYSVKIYNISHTDLLVNYLSKVKAGDLIAKSGNSEILVEYTMNGEYIDPMICFLS